MEIKVKDFLGEIMAVEDAILIRDLISKNLGKKITLDFDGLSKVPTTFLCCLFTDLIYRKGREYIFKQINVKNLSNYENYSRVVRGTAYNYAV